MSGVRFEARSGLLDRARRALERGPLTTAEVAGRVMGISGEPGAASRAVFALLGADPRFAVSAEGVWSLRREGPRAAASLLEEEWAVVDVETTGVSPDRGDRVTEIAAVRVTGGEVRDHFCTLVNPERPIPARITGLTGITNRMVADAPRFREVAHRVAGAMEGRVFVAHNASFDWRFVRAEMDRATGRVPEGRQLCTVRLARKLLPHLPSRSLGALAEYFGVPLESHHRALDDALATARLLLRMTEMLEERGVEDWAGVEALLKRRAARRPPRRTGAPRSMDQA